MASIVTDELIKDLRGLHAQTTQGVWGEGRSTHETVARYPNAPAYHVAEFRHANDASFIDACHEHLPAILDELEALRASAKNHLVASPAPSRPTEMAPRTNLPAWDECHESIEAVKGWDELSGFERPRDPTALEQFIYDYDDADPVSSSWFMHRLAKVIEEASSDFKMEDGALADAIRDRIVGMEVSVDVSTCEEDAGHRYFGTVTEVMDGSSADKFGVVLLVQDAKPNYEVKK